MAIEKPQVRRDIQLSDDLAFVVIPAFFTNAHNAVEHQHVGYGELSIARTKKATVTTLQQLFAAVSVLRDKGTHSVDSRSEEHTSELQSRGHLVCRLLLEQKKQRT